MSDIPGGVWTSYTPGEADLPPVQQNKNEYDKDLFLKLLMTEMQYQDPFDPMDDKEFVAQLAQFSTLEQMQQLNASYSMTQGNQMIGKFVVAHERNIATGEMNVIEGRVEGVIRQGGSVFVQVGQNLVNVDDVKEVYEDYFSLTIATSILNSINANQNINLVGSNVQAFIRNEDGEIAEFVEGKVDYIKFAGGMPILMVNGKEVYASEVFLISDEAILIGSDVSIKMDSEDDTYTTFNIKDVQVINGETYIENGEGSYLVNNISDLSEALNILGKEVKYQGEYRTVNDVIVDTEGDVYILLDDEEILYEDFIKEHNSLGSDGEDGEDGSEIDGDGTETEMGGLGSGGLGGTTLDNNNMSETWNEGTYNNIKYNGYNRM